jgi:hypothetical protein
MADYSQYVRQTWPDYRDGAAPPAAMLQHLEDGISALSAQLVSLASQIATLNTTAAANRYTATYLPTY